MKILRSFPTEPFPPGRAYVQDGLERFVTPVAFDYTGLLDRIGTDGVVLLEWDIAVSALDLGLFAQRWKGSDWPAVAPFLTRDGSHYLHWRIPADPLKTLRPIHKGEPDCDLFGFGMVYLPRWVLRDYPPGYGGSSILSDGSLPRWLQEAHGPRPVPVDWSVTVVHLA